ncbi:MAG: hypothetical protein H8D45_29820 [Bacteroidetes bacterium]|nr:hypothetical protein [Bacteroidota bacterium]MBL7102903.1 hypothetical protein [Bacteroidales bacterium]
MTLRFILGKIDDFDEVVKYKLDFNKIGLDGNLHIRDLWRQKDLGAFENDFETVIPVHGVILIKATLK